MSFCFLSWALLVGLAALCRSSAVPSSSLPTCKAYDGVCYRHIICRNFHSLEDFRQIIHDNHSDKPTWFRLWDCQVPRIPGGVFKDLNVSILEFSRVVVENFEPTEEEDNPFYGLEESLHRLMFSMGTLPFSWSILGHLGQLEELKLVHYKDMHLSSDFNNLPRNLKTLYVADATVQKIDDDWLAYMDHLQHLILRQIDLYNFTRSWLPNPAPHFTTLDLTTNKLTSFPAGLGDGLPALSYVSVERNLITTVSEEDLAPLKDKSVFVDLMFNPVHCDCKLAYILDYPTRWHYFLCATPGNVADNYITHLNEEQLQC
uniref:LRRCT domain-containing protein n=1 Tax=Amblyomma maculatum TaxID=34609 RepID=G3MR82_AMBMU